MRTNLILIAVTFMALLASCTDPKGEIVSSVEKQPAVDASTKIQQEPIVVMVEPQTIIEQDTLPENVNISHTDHPQVIPDEDYQEVPMPSHSDDASFDPNTTKKVIGKSDDAYIKACHELLKDQLIKPESFKDDGTLRVVDAYGEDVTVNLSFQSLDMQNKVTTHYARCDFGENDKAMAQISTKPIIE